jgi:hypothetical protein
MLRHLDTFIINHWASDCEFEFKVLVDKMPDDVVTVTRFTDTIYRYGARRRVYDDGRVIWTRKENRRVLRISDTLKAVCVREIPCQSDGQFLGPVVLIREQVRVSKIITAGWRADYSQVTGKPGIEMEIEWIGQDMPQWRCIEDLLISLGAAPE